MQAFPTPLDEALDGTVVVIVRHGDAYTAQVGPPELDREWATERSYGRDELRRIVEDLGVHPIDVADAFDQADRKAGFDRT